MNYTVAERLDRVRARIRSAIEEAGRDPGSVRLIGISKGMTVEAIKMAYAAGLVEFGENRVQEALGKMQEMEAAIGDPPVWHLVGRMQTNKARAVVGRFALIHSIDSGRLARAIHDAAERVGLVQRVMLQVNIGREPQKGGVDPDDVPELYETLSNLDHLKVLGLMAVPPWNPDPEASRSYFRALRRMGDGLSTGWADEKPIELSMGMSHDFHVAIQEGATMVRLGSAIFGGRAAGDGAPATLQQTG